MCDPVGVAPDGLALDREVLTAAALVVVAAGVLALPDLAAVGLCEPPHPATRIPLASVASASRRGLGERVRRVGWML
jgi:hypothetical protein